jgi:hypothetical protein
VKKIAIIGDSNVRFLKESVGNWHGLQKDSPANKLAYIKNKPESYWTGSETALYNEAQVTFIWQSRFPIARLNHTYLNKRINELSSAGGLFSPDFFVFQLGRVDLQLRLTSVLEIDRLVLHYLKVGSTFAAKYSAKAYFCTPIIHKDTASLDLIQYLCDSLQVACDSMEDCSFIDLTQVVSSSYASEDWDLDTHTTRGCSKEILDCIISTVLL